MSLLLTQASNLLVEQLDNLLIFVLGHSHTPLLAEIVHPLIELFHEGIILLIGFDLIRLLVQITERLLELPGRFSGAFGGFAVTHEPGVQSSQGLANANNDKTDTRAHNRGFHGNHSRAGHGSHC